MTEKFTRIRAGRYVNTETNVAIIQGESGRWFVYAPRPATEALHLFTSRATLAHAHTAAAVTVAVVREQRDADHATALDIEAEGERRAAKRALIADWQERVYRKATELESGVANMSDAWDAVLDDLHAEALTMNDPNEVIHFWTMDAHPSLCGVDVFMTPYTYGSDVLAEVTCPTCKPLATPINVGTLDNGAAVDALIARYENDTQADWPYSEVEAAVMRLTGCTAEGASDLIFAKSVASLADMG